MAFSTAQLQALEDAIASGELRVSYEGKTVEYRSVGELINARNLVRAALIEAGTLSAATEVRRSYATFAKG